jgi:hypothetical protein
MHFGVRGITRLKTCHGAGAAVEGEAGAVFGPDDVIWNDVESLQNELALSEAIEQRNAAQLDSFVDADHQWQAMDEADRWLLRRKGLVEKRIDALRASVGRGESAGGDVGRTEDFSQKKEEEEEEKAMAVVTRDEGGKDETRGDVTFLPLMLLLLFGCLKGGSHGLGAGGGGGGGGGSAIAFAQSAFSAAAAGPSRVGAEAAFASAVPGDRASAAAVLIAAAGGGDGRVFFMATQPHHHLAVEPVGVVLVLLLPLWAYKASAVANGQRLMWSLDLAIAMATAAAIKTILLG